MAAKKPAKKKAAKKPAKKKAAKKNSASVASVGFSKASWFIAPLMVMETMRFCFLGNHVPAGITKPENTFFYE